MFEGRRSLTVWDPLDSRAIHCAPNWLERAASTTASTARFDLGTYASVTGIASALGRTVPRSSAARDAAATLRYALTGDACLG
jgi:hypothetical protein